MAAAASGQALTKNQKKKLKKKLKKAGAGSQATDSGQQQETSHTDSDGSCGTGGTSHKWLRRHQILAYTPVLTCLSPGRKDHFP